MNAPLLNYMCLVDLKVGIKFDLTRTENCLLEINIPLPINDVFITIYEQRI